MNANIIRKCHHKRVHTCERGGEEIERGNKEKGGDAISSLVDGTSRRI